MRMLMPKRATRGLVLSEAVEPLETERAEGAQADLQAATAALGSRQEVLGSTLDEIGRLAGHLKRLDQMVAGLRDPLEQELTAHRHELGELITLRALLEQTAERLQHAREGERGLAARVANLEIALETAQAERHSGHSALQDAQFEIDGLRTALAETEARGEGHALALRDATLRARQLEEDVAFLRKQGQEDDSFRREIDALLTRSSQEALLLEEEAATLRRRLEQATAEAFRLTNVEADLQAQVAQERGRAMTLQASHERAQTELLQLRSQAEEQAASARAEIAALGARLETSGVRANRLEGLNADLARRLSEATSKHRLDERRVNEVQTAGERTAERVAAVEEELAAQRNANAALDRARLTALERADQLAKLLQSHEVTMRRAEERLREMQVKLEAGAADQEVLRRSSEQASADASAEIERLRAELEIAKAGLQSAHQERERHHIATLSGDPATPLSRPRDASLN